MGYVCCVPGCNNKFGEVQMHRFPHDYELYSTWVENIGCLNFMKQPQGVILRNKRICNIHFGPEFVTLPHGKRKSFLKENAVPTLFLPDKVLEKLGRGIYKVINESNTLHVQDHDYIKVEYAAENIESTSTSIIPAVASEIDIENEESKPEVHNLPGPLSEESSDTTADVQCINSHIVECIKRKVEKMDKKQKYCSILFGEISIDPNLSNDERHDLIEGCQDGGSLVNSSHFMADKVMVFMARGIFNKWKQPLAYFFNEGGMKSDVLATTIKGVVRSCRQSGLLVRTLICDQGSANVAAINKLYKETSDHYIKKGTENRLFGIQIDSCEVVPLYDPPHLLTDIRNNFFDNMVRFKWRKNHVEVGDWNHIRMVYLRDVPEEYDYKLCKKLTYNHIENTNEIKVSVAAEVFSNNVATAMHLGARSDQIPKEAESTAEFILVMDKIFDSVNGNTLKSEYPWKILRCGVTPRSPHESFWGEAIRVFESMEFFNEKENKIVPPSVKYWIHTLKGFCYLWDRFRGERIKLLLPRYLNQDPLAEFFEDIRSDGVANPNATFFVDSFESLVKAEI